MLIDQIADMIAKERGHDRALCNAKCGCYRLAYDIVGVTQEAHAARINELLAKLDERTTQLQRLKRLVGEEA